jgi:hypothetical protein
MDVHPAGEEPDNTSYAWPLGSHVWQPSVKSLLSQNRALAPGIINLCSQRSSSPVVILGCLILPPINHLKAGRYGSKKKLLSYSVYRAPYNPTCGQYKLKHAHWGQNDVVLNRHRWGLPPWNLGIAMARSPPFPSECSTFPYLPLSFTQTTMNINIYSSYPQ